MTSPPGAVGYDTMAVGGRLAGALLAVSRLFDQVGLQDDYTEAFLNHLWEWLTVDAATFDQWYSWWNPVLGMSLGDPVPSEILGGDSLSPDDFRGICEDVAELVWTNLFAAVQHDVTLRHLTRLQDRLARFGIELPPVEILRSSPVSDLHARQGWGATVSKEEVARLQTVVW